MSRRFNPLPDDRVTGAPWWPSDRPPTRREMWERQHALWFDRKEHRRYPACTAECRHGTSDELERYCKEAWVWAYVSAFNFLQWRKQPDWVEGDPVIEEAVPTMQFSVDGKARWSEIVYRCLELASSTHRQRRAA